MSSTAGNGGTIPPEEIAVIGIGCRFPGATNLEEFWRVLENGENHIREIPRERWVCEDFYDPDSQSGKSYTNKAGFISNLADFDHKLFGISETEASQMDPQQRHVLECTYMALENAGITRQQISGQKVGVYIGSMNADYHQAMINHKDLVDQYSVAGLANSVISNRVSYIFNLTGPSMTIDTACSSSLVSIHQASLALRAGDCDLAICGGVSLICHPELFESLCKAEMLSKTGQCHAFSNSADGYTRGEGCGIVILKPLDKAKEERDNIWGTVATALNQDGRYAQPITAPSQQQQERLLKEVFSKHQINPSTVQYIEAHGTGTKRGDPVEVNAFGSFFEEQKEPKRRHIGSVKTNIGHLEPAAGVVGLIKVLLMMKHNTIVPSLHFDKPNELIEFDKFQFTVPTSCLPWDDHVKVSCLNSFGFGGANSHAIIRRETVVSGQLKTNGIVHGVVCFSGSTIDSLKASMVDYLKNSEGIPLNSIVHTSLSRREHYKFRKVVLAESKEILRENVKNFLSEAKPVISVTTEKPHVAFVFCGMGTAWNGMCKVFLEKYKVFRDAIGRIDISLKRFVSWSLQERICESYDVDDVLYGPIVIFATQIGLSHMMRSFGVTAKTVIGQSVGEVAAAHVAGILPLDEAVKVIYHRTKIMMSATGGKMLLIRNLETQTVEKMCEPYKKRVSVALYYSPVSCTVSGDRDAIDDLEAQLMEMKTRKHSIDLINLKVSSAFHSPHMDPCQEQLDAVLQDLKTEQPSIEMVSTVDHTYTSSDVTSVKYWGQNVRRPVKFYDALQAVKLPEKVIFLEIGPQPVLRAHLEDIFDGEDIPLSLMSMTRDGNGEELLRSLSKLFERNIGVKWDNFVDDRAVPSPVPRYSFSQKTLWKIPPISEEHLGRKTSGGHLFVKPGRNSCECAMTITPSIFGTVYEHKVNGVIVVPGVTYAETGLSIASILGLGSPFAAQVSVKFSSPITLKKGHPTQVDIHVASKSSKKSLFTVMKGETTHAEGTIIVHNESWDEERIAVETIKARCPNRVTGSEVYQMLEHFGFTYGSNFATIDYAFRGDGESLAVLKLSPQLQEEMKQTHIHPAVLDSLLQCATIAYFHQGELLPIALYDVTVRKPLTSEMLVYSKVTDVDSTRTSFFLCLLSSDGTVLAQVRKFVTEMTDTTIFDPKQGAYINTWREVDDTVGVQFPLEQVVLISDIDACDHDFGMKHIELKQVASSSMEALSKIINHDNKALCVAFRVPDILPYGRNLVDAIFERIQIIRLFVLYFFEYSIQIPLIIAMEERSSKDAYGIETATSCMNEAISAFCRSVTREYKSLNLKAVHIDVLTSMDLTLNIQKVVQTLLSDSMGHVSDVRIEKDKQLVKEVEASSSTAPPYRHNTDAGSGLLCSRSQKMAYDPFLLSQDNNAKGEGVGMVLTKAVLHSNKLSVVTAPFGASFGSSSDRAYPMLALEMVCREKSKTEDVVVCYPTRIQKRVTVPKQCTIDKIHVPSYEAGHLLKLYILWCMAKVPPKKSVALLYLPDTEPMAKALQMLLQKRKSKNVTLLTPGEVCVGQHSFELLISTISLDENVATYVVSSWQNLKVVVTIQQLTSDSTMHILKYKHGLKVDMLCPADMFSPDTMGVVSAEMIKWVKKNSTVVQEIFHLLQSCVCLELESSVMPIKITEILHTTEFSVSPLKDVAVREKDLIRNSSSYLVVGGLTGLGWECVSYLACKGAGCVIILNRRKAEEKNLQEMNDLSKEYGCQIKSIQGDVSRFETLKAALNEVKGCFDKWPLAGVFFGAGILQDGSLLELTEEKFKQSLMPKISGSWNIHCLLKHTPLEIFMCHSSLTAMLGNPGQSNYGTGNGFMDGLCNGRQKAGLSGQSINWGPLQMGMLENKDLVMRRLQNAGYDSILKKDIGTCLTYLLLRNDPQLAMMRINRRKMAESLIQNKEMKLLKRLQSFLRVTLKDTQDSGSKFSLDVDKVKKSSHDDAAKILREYLKKLACDKALLDEDTFDLNEEMKAQGVDSMYAMEISSQIHSDTGTKLSAQEIQLQSTETLATLMATRMLTKDTLDRKDIDFETIVKRETIMKSIAFSFFWFNLNHCDVSHVLICTVKLPDAVDASVLRRKLSQFLNNHKFARSILTSSDTFELRELGVEDALQLEEDVEPDQSKVIKFKSEPINPMTQPPVRFLFRSDKRQLLLMFHKFFFDISAVMVFVREMLHDNSSEGMDADNIDIVEEIQAVVVPQYQTLLAFWKSGLSHTPRIDLVFKEILHLNESQQHLTVTRKLGDRVYRKFMEFIKDHKLVGFEYCVSLYQLLISIFSKSMSSVVTTSFDMRKSVPSIANSVGRCTNLIPLICQRGERSQTISQFLERNVTLLEAFLKNGILPFEEIRQLVSKDRVDMISKHFFVFEDDTLTSVHNDLIVEQSVDFPEESDTLIYVWQKRHTKDLELKLHLNKMKYTLESGDRLMDAYVDILCTSLTNPDVTIDHLIKKYTSSPSSETQRRVDSKLCALM